MFTNTPIYSIMTPKPDVVHPNDSMDKVRKLFETKPYHHLPVLDKDKLVGMISYTDYVRVISCAFDHPKQRIHNDKLLNALLVKDIMSTTLVTLESDQPISEAIQIFKENRYHALPIVRRDGSLEGIVTVFDFLGLAEFFLEKADSEPVDEQFLGC